MEAVKISSAREAGDLHGGKDVEHRGLEERVGIRARASANLTVIMVAATRTTKEVEVVDTEGDDEAPTRPTATRHGEDPRWNMAG